MTPARPFSGRRGPVLALALCAVGAAVTLAAATRGWVTVGVARASPLPPVTLTETGRGAEPVVPALGVVGLAGVVGLLATGRVGRRVLGGLLTVAGLVVVARALPHLAAPSRDDALALLDARGLMVSVGADATVSARAHPLWPALAGFGGLLGATGGLVALLRGPSWPTMSGRYEAPGRRRSGTASSAGAQALWEAIDRGEDPTC